MRVRGLRLHPGFRFTHQRIQNGVERKRREGGLFKVNYFNGCWCEQFNNVQKLLCMLKQLSVCWARCLKTVPIKTIPTCQVMLSSNILLAPVCHREVRWNNSQGFSAGMFHVSTLVGKGLHIGFWLISATHGMCLLVWVLQNSIFLYMIINTPYP